MIKDSYEASRLASRSFYDLLRKQQRIRLIDSSQIFNTLQSAYRKTFLLPSALDIKAQSGWLRDGHVWVGLVSGQQIVDLHNQHGEAIFFENIRDFLGPRSGLIAPDEKTVNEKITDTVISAPARFLERNNGITIKAVAVDVQTETPDVLTLREASIVNGCQTTVCLARAGSNAQGCFVLTKVVKSDDAWEVAKAANYQNQIKRIELDLAQYLRPQLVRQAAVDAGYDVRERERDPASAVELLGDFYEGRISYEEIKVLYVGLMSNSPNNIGDQLYTKLRNDLIQALGRSEAD